MNITVLGQILNIIILAVIISLIVVFVKSIINHQKRQRELQEAILSKLNEILELMKKNSK